MIVRAQKTMRDDNNPPVFGTPNPFNESTNLPLSFTWSIPINDTEGNVFDWTIECSNGQFSNATVDSNGTKILALSGLGYMAMYTIWVNASDAIPGGSGQWTRAWFTFTTKQEDSIMVTINSPSEHGFYFNDQRLFTLKNSTFIYGPITIIANVSADAEVEKVEFYIDDTLENTTTTSPYEYVWNPKIVFKGLSIKHTIMVKAYDINGKNATATLNVSKWKFHPLIVAAGALLLLSTLNIRLIPHTTITGWVFHMKQKGSELSFFALRVHYTTAGLLKSESGIIRCKRITIPNFIGPRTMLQLGPLHLFTWISISFLGRIHYASEPFTMGDFQSLFNTIRQPSTCGFP